MSTLLGGVGWQMCSGSQPTPNRSAVLPGGSDLSVGRRRTKAEGHEGPWAVPVGSEVLLGSTLSGGPKALADLVCVCVWVSAAEPPDPIWVEASLQL